MRKLVFFILILTGQTATGQNFQLKADGNIIANHDTVVRTVIGNGGWYSEVVNIDIQNTSSQNLIINIIQDDANVISPAYVYIGCGSFGCIPPGLNNPSINFQLNAGIDTHFTSPGFECSGSSCSGSHIAAYTIYDQSGISGGVTFYIRYEIPVTVSIDEIAEPVISVQPNPASNFISVRSNHALDHIEVYDVLGNLTIRNTSCNSGNCVIEISSLTGGVYFLKASFDEKTVVQRILVHR